MMIERCCAFTGHRPKKFPWGYDEADSRCVALKQALAEQIVSLVGMGYTDFFSGMAEGVDAWAALAVLSLKKENSALKLHSILPCEGQADGWSASARELYDSILEEADEVVYVSREYSKDCMLKRNRYLVDHSSCQQAGGMIDQVAVPFQHAIFAVLPAHIYNLVRLFQNRIIKFPR